MRLLAIETSCDETSVAVVRWDNGRLFVEKNFVASQIKEHALYGGVVREVAARRHVDALYPLIRATEIAPDGSDITAVAVTPGPGLIPALRIGVEAAKTLAWAWKQPLIPVHHMEGHLYSVFLPDPSVPSEPELLADSWFPAVCLSVSGGHTELLVIHGHGMYERAGNTRDDAAGEAFDKVGQLLGLPYPGGPKISLLATRGNPNAIPFPRPMIKSENDDFSFSGLKTAVAVYLRSHPIRSEQNRADIAASFQEAAVDVLVTKTIRLAQKIHPASVLLCGGVSANTRLREVLLTRLRESIPKSIPRFAPLIYTGDNAAMIGAAGVFRFLRGETADPLTLVADPN